MCMPVLSVPYKGDYEAKCKISVLHPFYPRNASGVGPQGLREAYAREDTL